METVIIFAACYLVGVLFGVFLKTADYKRKESPAIGYIKFNVNNPEKEFLELHIVRDIDIDHPPRTVKFSVIVERDMINGSISR